MTRPTALGAYVYAGGFTLGVADYFDVVATFEGADGYGAASHEMNWPDVRVFRGNWPVKKYRGKVDFIYCNPPCAIWSAIGVSITKGRDAWKTDPRTNCWHECVDLLRTVQPGVLAVESVPGAYSEKKGKPLIDQFTRKALKLGYSVTHLLVNAKWLNCAQSRNRFFFIAHRAPVMFPQPNWGPTTTVREALEDVDDPGWIDPSTAKNPQILALLKRVGPGEGLRDAWEAMVPEEDRVYSKTGRCRGRPMFMEHRLSWDKTSGAMVGNYYYHPGEDRKLGINELKAICGYPLDYQLEGKPQDHPSLLARAVMPPVARWLAGVLVGSLSGTPIKKPVVLRIDLRKPPREGIDHIMNITEDYHEN